MWPFFLANNISVSHLCNLNCKSFMCDIWLYAWLLRLDFDIIHSCIYNPHLIPFCAALLSHLADHQSPVVGLSGVDYPEAILIHSQVNVRFPSPAVGRSVMVVGVCDNGLATLDACPQVILDNVSCAFFVVKHCTVVHHKPRAVNSVGQPVDRESYVSEWCRNPGEQVKSSTLHDTILQDGLTVSKLTPQWHHHPYPHQKPINQYNSRCYLIIQDSGRRPHL